MKLTVVGCSGSYPGPDSPASCYLLEAEHEGRTWRILVDLGNGALGALHRYADPLAVDAVFLSHLHADHCLDLCGYHVMRRYHPEGPQPRIPVWGPAGTAERMARAYDLPEDTGMREEFDFAAYDALTELQVGPFRVHPVPVTHPVEAYGLRISADGSTVAYTGDTGPCEALDGLATAADLLLAEASFRAGDDNPPDLHLTGEQAGQLAARAEAGRLVLTHIPPWYDRETMLAEARGSFDGPSELAAPGATYRL